MTFGLTSWLKSKYSDLNYEVPVWYPSHDRPDHREWLVTNGRGGYASSTISGAHTRSYHGALVAALNEPTDRYIILSKIEESVSLDGKKYNLQTNHWASGVVSPTGFKRIESFTNLPVPTWVFNLDGHYLIKQLTIPWGTNEVHVAYHWLPDEDQEPAGAELTVRLLTGYRSFHGEVKGSASKSYSQASGDDKSTVMLNAPPSRLQLKWTKGEYTPKEQWWWNFHWPEEYMRAQPDSEDLFLFGQHTSSLDKSEHLEIIGSLNVEPECKDWSSAIKSNIKRQNLLLDKASLPRSPEISQLVLSCDQFIVGRTVREEPGLSVIAGYPWYNDSGRETMIAAPGLTLATRRYGECKQILNTYSKLIVNGLMPNRFQDGTQSPEFQAVDTTLWWAWSLYQYFNYSNDRDFVAEAFPKLTDAAWNFVEGTGHGIKVDPDDGLLSCAATGVEFTWMDARVAGIPITPRSGKAVDICALWYNLLGTLIFFARELNEDLDEFSDLSKLCGESMQRFWNEDEQCLYDVIDPDSARDSQPVAAIRPNQIFAVSMPFRALTESQEKAIMTKLDMALFTPTGLRSLAPTDPSYQERYGCGFKRADQYHRDLSFHQGCVWPWLIGAYCDALLNVHGPLPETYAKIRILLQPLLNHLIEERCVGSVSELFDGNVPQLPHGCVAQATSVAELMRILALAMREEPIISASPLEKVSQRN